MEQPVKGDSNAKPNIHIGVTLYYPLVYIHDSASVFVSEISALGNYSSNQPGVLALQNGNPLVLNKAQLGFHGLIQYAPFDSTVVFQGELGASEFRVSQDMNEIMGRATHASPEFGLIQAGFAAVLWNAVSIHAFHLISAPRAFFERYQKWSFGIQFMSNVF